MALIERDIANPHGQIDATTFSTDPAEISKENALKLCVSDAESAEAWLTNNYWSLRWREGDALYQSPPGILMWEGTTVPRANLNRFVVAETLNSIHPQIMNGLFYENPPFILRPRPTQQANTVRAITELLAIQVEQMNVRREVDWGLFSALLFGTAVWKWGFKSYTKKTTKYVRAGESIKIQSTFPGQRPTEITTPDTVEFKKVIEDEDVHVPFFENRDIRYVLVDPGLAVADIRKAKFVIDRMYLTYRDLEKLADEEYVTIENGKQVFKKRYDLPSKEEIKSWFEPPQEQPSEGMKSEAVVVQGTTFVHHAKPKFQKSTADPLDEPLEVLERWDNDKVITVLNRVKAIRNEPNEWGKIPFLSVNWWNIPDAFWGLGLGRVIGTEQRVQQGIINASLDLASLIVNPMFVRARAANIQDQQIRQRVAGILTVDVGGPEQPKSTKEAISLLEQPTIPSEIIQQLSLSMQRVESTSGANAQLTMGATPTSSRGQMGRSGTGAAGIIQATMNRLGGFAEAFVRQVYEPLLYELHQMNKDKTPMSYIQKLLGRKLGPDFTFDPSDFLNSEAEFEVLAGSHLAAKSQMSQSLFMLVQLFENPAIMDQLNKLSGKVVDVEELLHMIYDVSGFKNTYYQIIREMTPAEQARQQQQANPMQQKVQAQMAVNQQKFGQQQQIIDQENQARVVRDIFRHLAETSMQPQPTA